MRKSIAVWQSKGGAYRVELWKDERGYCYTGNGCGGNLGAFESDGAALALFEPRVLSGEFQPDKNTTPMRRSMYQPAPEVRS